jgi:flagellar basal body-associated protein FliL
VGVDDEAAVKAFVLQCPAAAPEAMEDPARARSRSSARWLTLAVALLALLAVAAGVYFWAGSKARAATVSIGGESR